MKRLALLITSLILINRVWSQSSVPFEDTVGIYFKEIEKATKRSYKLWDRNLYGPVLLVNETTKQAYANVPDSAGILKKKGDIYIGTLPGSIPIANYSFHWNGRDWAMIMLSFLPPDTKGKINLTTHELFHKAQPSLGFPRVNAKTNNHLDQKDARVYLRLELEALHKALWAKNNRLRMVALTAALSFRKYRHLLYPGAEESENIIELNEGLAEYTGAIISGRNKREMLVHFKSNWNKFLSNPSFTKSFPYYTIPVYGYLLSAQMKYWNKQVNPTTNLTSYFISAFSLILPADLKKKVEAIANQYNFQTILLEENLKEGERKKVVSQYKEQFFNQPCFVIKLIRKNISFDARFLVVLEDYGTVYPAMTATDEWGSLTVSKGALLNDIEKSIRITTPLTIKDMVVTGDGWTLNLNPGYRVIYDKESGQYKLINN